MPTIINIVSGKGGTGKTLLCATLADLLGNHGASVLVVDMDVFVRGLTALLYFHRGESLRLADANDKSIADLFIDKHKVLAYKSINISVQRYRSFDVVPSVSRIDELLSFRDISPDTFDEAVGLLRILLRSVPEHYDFVFLDSRAGYDELVAATHSVSDISVCIQEEDPISNVTAENLARQLEKDSRNPVLRIINKARRVRTKADLEHSGSPGFAFVGSIPFDMDVMNSFGKPHFWDEISRSLYIAGVVHSWNRISKMLRLGHELPTRRISPFGSENFEARVGVLGLNDRIMFVMGMLLGALGILYAAVGPQMMQALREDPSRAVATYLGFSGIALALFVFMRKST